ncbi:MAG: solute carrier family 23 protein [Thermoanaerobaculia bacterium]
MQRAEVRTEAIAGITTFFTMAYIIFVNPAILATEGTGMSFSGVMTATVIVAGVMTLFMGLYAKIPFAVAPGMGLNAFFAYTVVLGQGVSWQTALGLVFWSGVAFVVVSVTPIRVAIAKAIPHSLRIAAAAGVGIMLTFLGLKNAGFIVPGVSVQQARFLERLLESGLPRRAEARAASRDGLDADDRPV